MKRNTTYLLTFLILIIMLVFRSTVSIGERQGLDMSLIPADTIAVFFSPEESNQSQIIYVVHGITVDEDMLSINVRQISTDPQFMIYEEDTTNESEQSIRFRNEFTEDTPIVGSCCEMMIENDRYSEEPRDRWYYCQQNSSMKYGYYLDETFLFALSEIGDIDKKCTLHLSYGCIPVPGTLGDNKLCALTIDIADYLK